MQILLPINSCYKGPLFLLYQHPNQSRKIYCAHSLLFLLAHFRVPFPQYITIYTEVSKVTVSPDLKKKSRHTHSLPFSFQEKKINWRLFLPPVPSWVLVSRYCDKIPEKRSIGQGRVNLACGVCGWSPVCLLLLFLS